ncbi:MAG: DUF1573 domain-containing protein [Bacteroidales bacterium]|nr:DUF1573 domain-containing protein [Bacteroidales bacterium]
MKLYKNILILLAIAVFGFACNNSGNKQNYIPADVVNNPKTASGKELSKGVPRISFEKDLHDFGRVIEGEKITYAFRFSNSGSSDLIITDVNTSCGCTVPEFTKEPLKPGEKGTIKVTFDSSNRKGFQNKSITVISNTIPSTTELKIKAMVIVPENY